MYDHPHLTPVREFVLAFKETPSGVPGFAPQLFHETPHSNP